MNTTEVIIRFTLSELYDNREFEHLIEFLQDKAQEQVNLLHSTYGPKDIEAPEISIVDFEIVGEEGGHTVLVKVGFETF